jgi:pyruvate formate lyase activating enzyme
MTVEAVLSEVVRDRAFYETSDGGMTLSGGEPTHQIEFTAALLEGGRQEGLHCCVETCGACSYERLACILPTVDLFLFDWKESDPDRHGELTGMPNAHIRDNLHRLHAAGALIRLRCPIIPGVNDRDDHLRGIAELARALPRLEGVQILPYHRLGEGKLERFGLDADGRVDAEAPSPEAVRGWVERLESLGVNVLDAEG